MTKRRNNVAKRLAKVERELKKDKPEVKTIDHLVNPVGDGTQPIYEDGIWNGTALVAYDLTDGFIQGLENTGGNIDGNFCKLTSMDLRVLLQSPKLPSENNSQPLYKVRMMIVRLPNATTMTPVEIQGQVLEYGKPVTWGELANVSPLKRNSTINGGYDVMYDKVHIMTGGFSGGGATAAENTLWKSFKYVRFRKKWKNGLTLRFSGVAGALALEQNRIYLFAMDATAGTQAEGGDASTISFVNRIRYSDE